VLGGVFRNGNIAWQRAICEPKKPKRIRSHDLIFTQQPFLLHVARHTYSMDILPLEYLVTNFPAAGLDDYTAILTLASEFRLRHAHISMLFCLPCRHPKRVDRCRYDDTFFFFMCCGFHFLDSAYTSQHFLRKAFQAAFWQTCVFLYPRRDTISVRHEECSCLGRLMMHVWLTSLFLKRHREAARIALVMPAPNSCLQS
jgi:hypothetical protein